VSQAAAAPALSSAALLWRRETGPKGHGLEEARTAAVVSA